MNWRLIGVIACLGMAFGAWISWGIITIRHAEDPLSWWYCVGSAASVLGPLFLALYLLVRDKPL